MKSLRAMCVLLVLGLVLAGYAEAAVPQAVSYQGKLTTSGQTVADGDYSVTFAIYSVSLNGSPLWTEHQTVTTKSGLFTVQLGSVTPFPLDLFETSPRYLGIAISGNPEISPRTQMASVPFALYAGNLAGGPCAACSTVFVNTRGPDALRAAADTAFKVVDSTSAASVAFSSRLSAQSPDTVSAIRGTAYNAGAGWVDAGSFNSTSIGTGAARGVYGTAYQMGVHSAFGIYGSARTEGTGGAYGGRFIADAGGAGLHYGVYATSASNAGQTCFGLYAGSENTSTGWAYGGSFSAIGNAKVLGLFSNVTSNSADTAFGMKVWSRNRGSGTAVGNYLYIDSSGTGNKFGLMTETNAGDGSAYGTWSDATSHSWNAQGIVANGYNTGTSTTSNAFGGSFTGDAQAGTGYGGFFLSYSSTGETYGILSSARLRSSSQPGYGVYGQVLVSAKSTFAGSSYAGYFENLVQSGVTTCGVYTISNSNNSTSASYGVYGRSEHHGSGTSYAGYLLADSTGTGPSYGGRIIGLSKGSAYAYGVAGIAASRGSGNVYGGYFSAYDYGTGTKYGIYSTAPSSGYAGYFSGNVYVSGNQAVAGTKSAAVEVAPNEYRLVYSQESPECWFEDFGEAKLVNGRVHIDLDDGFQQTVTIDQTNPMKVFIQVNDPNCNGTAVIRGTTGFDVVELMKGKSSASFSYRVVAKRKGYESVRLAHLQGEAPAQVSAKVSADSTGLAVDEAAMEQSRLQQQLKRQQAEEAREQEGNVH